MVKFSFRRRDNINIGRVVSKIAISLIALWAGGTILTVLGDTMKGTASPFYSGLSLIGWTVQTNTTCGSTAGSVANCITATNGAGILGVIGLIAIASIVMEFVQVRMG